MASANRINARLDEPLARKLDLVRKLTRHSLSHIVKESLHRYCDQELDEARQPLSLLQAAGFIGCADGPADLSSGYKREIEPALRRKT